MGSGEMSEWFKEHAWEPFAALRPAWFSPATTRLTAESSTTELLTDMGGFFVIPAHRVLDRSTRIRKKIGNIRRLKRDPGATECFQGLEVVTKGFYVLLDRKAQRR